MRRRALSIMTCVCVALANLLVGCAEGGDGDTVVRAEIELNVEFSQELVVPSSELSFQFLNTQRRAAVGALVSFQGELDNGRVIEESFYLPVDRVGERGDLVVNLRVFDGLFDAVAPSPVATFTGDIVFELDDQIGTFANARLADVSLDFDAEYEPSVVSFPTDRDVFANEPLPVRGRGFLRPEEGTTWARVDSAEIVYGDGSRRLISNARIPTTWTGSRSEAAVPVLPEIFGVRGGTFRGDVHFENEFRTGETIPGATVEAVELTLLRSRIDSIDPPAGSRGQKVTVTGRGFLPSNDARNYGMYFVFEGRFDPDKPGIPTQTYEGPGAFVKVPYRVVDYRTIQQDVWYEILPEGQLSGLGATPGRFEGTITPVLFDAQDEVPGEPWTGEFRVLPTRQVVYVKYLPAFSRALELYGLQNVEEEVRDRIMYVLRRDYSGVNVEFKDVPPGDFVEYTTIEIGGPDPSGLLNFGYDNSFNEGGKDIGNLYLSDYLGGVNKHSEDAGYLAYGGVFIESFIAFSPTLFPDNFGTSPAFDRVLAPFMTGLGGQAVGGDEWPEGPRVSAIRNAIELLGNLTGHTASHEIGHSLGLAHFPATVDGYAERFHNDPPGERLIMDSGSERPFEERAEVDGSRPARFSDENLEYLRLILPVP